MGVALAHNEKPKGSGVLQVVLGTPVFLLVSLDYYPLSHIVYINEPLKPIFSYEPRR
jgi:hypothetical protein